VTLKQGKTPIRLTFFEKTGEQDLIVTWSGPGVDQEKLSIRRSESPQERALNTLAGIFEDRKQYVTAADTWRDNIDRFGPGRNQWKQKRLDQIVGNWGRMESTGMHPAGSKVELGFTFRNATEVSFTAHRIKHDQFLKDMKNYIKSDPKNLDWNKTSVDRLGRRLVYDNETRYVGKEVAAWDQKLKPEKGHGDKRVELKTPLSEAGIYLVKANLTDGNTTRILVWVTDTIIVDRPVHENHVYFLADAKTGKPIPNATLEFFGYRKNYVRNERRYRTRTINFAEKSDTNGLVYPERKLFEQGFSWLITSSGEDGGRFAALGFSRASFSALKEIGYHRAKAYIVTDRPVYRPDQTVEISSWVRHARYDLKNISRYAGQRFTVRLQDPQRKQILEKEFTADEYGRFDLKYELPDDAKLGAYNLTVVAKNFADPVTDRKRKLYQLGSLQFRVEEYKKPEFEVTVDAPAEPSKLGERIEATIMAKYYFGAPVNNAKVKYTVRRTEHDTSWIPPRPWDWFYGPGYWWFTPDYEWYPGWRRWGCFRPGWFRAGPPEIVQENTVEIGEDGTVKVEIDTAVTKALHGDTDHRYEITAEVVDESRRTIVGKGSVIAAREPFKVFTWLDGGHFVVGDDIKANFKGRTPDGKPVQGQGKATLFSITYGDENEPEEEEVRSWDVDTDVNGGAELPIKAHKAGQYRLSYALTDAKGNQREGATLITVRGRGFDGEGFRFNDIELTLDKAEYQPGDRVKLLVSTARKKSTVALFIRPAHGVYPKPIVMSLKGGGEVKEIEIAKKDMPNIFVEAFTVSDGRVFNTQRKIVVPPEKRVLTVDVEPSETRYKPGETGMVKITLSDIDGNPFKGNAVVTVYDKSVEYIS
ncbi:MAG: MG2 domain-containing protein, partial [Verrucomicrobiota bacterium]